MDFFELQKIQHALNKNKPVNLTALRGLAPKGYTNTRKEVWPLLLGVTNEDRKVNAPLPEEKIDKSHRDFDQITKDVLRSLHHLDVTKNLKTKKRERYRGVLSRILHTIFSVHPHLHYTQGFHDVCTIFVLVAKDEKDAYLLSERLVHTHIREFMSDKMTVPVAMMSLILPLLGAADSETHDFLVSSEVELYFTASWVLTWFSHNLEELESVCRVFDFLLASHPLAPVYVATAAILEVKADLLKLPPDPSEVHLFFQDLPKTSGLNVPHMIQRAQALLESYPPSSLKKHLPKPFPPKSCMSIGDEALPMHLAKNSNHIRNTWDPQLRPNAPRRTAVNKWAIVLVPVAVVGMAIVTHLVF